MKLDKSGIQAMELKISFFPRIPSPLQLPQVPLSEKEEEHKEQEGGGGGGGGSGRQRGRWHSSGRKEAEAPFGPEGEDGSQPIPLWKILKLKIN